MEKIIDILQDINPDIDYKNRTDLIDAHLLDSLSIISLIAELEDTFDVTIPAVDIIPDNFYSVKAISALIERLHEED